MKPCLGIALPLLAATLFLYSCVKNDVPVPDSPHQTVSSNVTAPDLNKCKIRRIYQKFSATERPSALFTYNKAGNPLSVIYANGGTGVDDHHFIYDGGNRLIEYRLTWGDYINEQHYYEYNSKGQIVKDSFLNNNCCGVLEIVDVSTLTYDAAGRVVKETIVNKLNVDGPLNPTRRPTYTYDNRGNLAVAGWKSSSYDNKINPLRQNSVFQFIHRNYSMNNAAVQAKYNSIGLPLSMNPTNDAFFNGFNTDLVIYDCP